jgi:hypothetical protein
MDNLEEKLDKLIEDYTKPAKVVLSANNKLPMQYNFWKGLRKGIIAFVLFAIPFLLTNYPELTNITIGAVLILILNWVKVRFGLKI